LKLRKTLPGKFLLGENNFKGVKKVGQKFIRNLAQVINHKSNAQLVFSPGNPFEKNVPKIALPFPNRKNPE